MTRSRTSVVTPPSSKPSKKKRASASSVGTKKKAKPPRLAKVDVTGSPFLDATTFDSILGEAFGGLETDADEWPAAETAEPRGNRNVVTLEDIKRTFWSEHDDDEDHGAYESVNKLSRLIHDIATDKGWWYSWGDDADITEKMKAVQEKLLMIHSEVSEATEELREFDPSRPYANLAEEEFERGGKPVGLAIELADIIIRTLDLMAFIGADASGLLYDKMRYNLTRPHRHGGKNL